MKLTWCENELNQQLSSPFHFWSPGNRGIISNEGRSGGDVSTALTSVGLRWFSVIGWRAPAIDFEIQISELSFSENFALTLISIWLEAIGTSSRGLITAHTLSALLEKPKITSNKLSQIGGSSFVFASQKFHHFTNQKFFEVTSGRTVGSGKFQFWCATKRTTREIKMSSNENEINSKILFCSPPAGSASL